MKERTALLIGATGLIGSNLLDLLLASAKYRKINVLTRHSLNIKHVKLQQVIMDFEKLDECKTNDIFQVDDVFCCIGTTMNKAKNREQFRRVDFEYPVTIARLAREAGARQFLIVSSLGANIQSPFFYSRVKGEMEEAVASIGYPLLHIFRPSLLLGERLEFRLGEFFAQKLGSFLAPLFVGPFYRFKPVKASVVAADMLEVAIDNY